jgi:hypothetical protein
VGYWSDEDLYLGVMEAADIVFGPDGNGWVYWSRDGGGYFIVRFGWHAVDGRELVLGLREKLSGSWDRVGSVTRHHVASQAQCDTEMVLGYEIRAGQDVFGRPARLLGTGQPVVRGAVGDRFAFKRALAGAEQDPVARAAAGR